MNRSGVQLQDESSRIITFNSSIVRELTPISDSINWNGRTLELLNPNLVQSPTWSTWTLPPEVREVAELPTLLSRLIQRINLLLEQHPLVDCLDVYVNQLDKAGQATSLRIRETLADQRTLPLISSLLMQKIKDCREHILLSKIPFPETDIANWFFPNDQCRHFLNLLSYPFAQNSPSSEGLDDQLYQTVRDYFLTKIRPELIKVQLESWLELNRHDDNLSAFLQSSVIVQNGKVDEIYLTSLHEDVFCQLDCTETTPIENIVAQLALVNWENEDGEELVKDVCAALAIACVMPHPVSENSLRAAIVEWLRPTPVQQRINIVNFLLKSFGQQFLVRPDSMSFDKIVSKLDVNWILDTIPAAIQSLVPSLDEETLLKQLPGSWQIIVYAFEKKDEPLIQKISHLYQILQHSQVTRSIDEIPKTHYTIIELNIDYSDIHYVPDLRNVRIEKIHRELEVLTKQAPAKPISLVLNSSDLEAIQRMLVDLENNQDLQNRIESLYVSAEGSSDNAFVPMLDRLPNLKSLQVYEANKIDEDCFNALGRLKLLSSICFNSCHFNNHGKFLYRINNKPLRSLGIENCNGITSKSIETFVKKWVWEGPQSNQNPTDYHHLLLNGTDVALQGIEEAARKNKVYVFHESYAVL